MLALSKLVCLIAISLLSSCAIAAGIQPDPAGEQFVGKILQVVLALAVTLGTIWGLSKLAMNKRWTAGAGNQRIRVLDSLAVGTRDRIMLLEVDDKNILVASTPGHIRSLHAFDKKSVDSFHNAMSSASSDDTFVESSP